MGTDMGRANNSTLVDGSTEVSDDQTVASLFLSCTPGTVIKIDEGYIKPCGEFEGVSLVGKPRTMLKPTPSEGERGYVANPLDGIWAQAPYLHNGSVPTLFQLLVPTKRPDVFIKARLKYDQEGVGYQWRNKDSETSDGYRYDTTIAPALSNKGHDTDDEAGGYILDWSKDEEGAKAIVEYLKLF